MTPGLITEANMPLPILTATLIILPKIWDAIISNNCFNHGCSKNWPHLNEHIYVHVFKAQRVLCDTVHTAQTHQGFNENGVGNRRWFLTHSCFRCIFLSIFTTLIQPSDVFCSLHPYTMEQLLVGLEWGRRWTDDGRKWRQTGSIVKKRWIYKSPTKVCIVPKQLCGKWTMFPAQRTRDI